MRLPTTLTTPLPTTFTSAVPATRATTLELAAATIIRTGITIHAAMAIVLAVSALTTTFRSAINVAATARATMVLGTAVEPRTITTGPALAAEVLTTRTALLAGTKPAPATAFRTTTFKPATLGSTAFKAAFTRTATIASPRGRTIRTSSAPTLKAATFRPATLWTASVGATPLGTGPLPTSFGAALARAAAEVSAIARTASVIISTAVIRASRGAATLHVEPHLLTLGMGRIRRGHTTIIAIIRSGLSRSQPRQQHQHRHRTHHLPGHTNSLRYANSLASLNAAASHVLPRIGISRPLSAPLV